MSYTLPCGCIPDASGFGYCPDCEKKLRAKILAKMTTKEKNYDRYVNPGGCDDYDDYDGEPSGCSCHINPPCSYCVNKNSDDE